MLWSAKERRNFMVTRLPVNRQFQQFDWRRQHAHCYWRGSTLLGIPSDGPQGSVTRGWHELLTMLLMSVFQRQDILWCWPCSHILFSSFFPSTFFYNGSTCSPWTNKQDECRAHDLVGFAGKFKVPFFPGLHFVYLRFDLHLPTLHVRRTFQRHWGSSGYDPTACTPIPGAAKVDWPSCLHELASAWQAGGMTINYWTAAY